MSKSKPRPAFCRPRARRRRFAFENIESRDLLSAVSLSAPLTEFVGQPTIQFNIGTMQLITHSPASDQHTLVFLNSYGDIILTPDLAPASTGHLQSFLDGLRSVQAPTLDPISQIQQGSSTTPITPTAPPTLAPPLAPTIAPPPVTPAPVAPTQPNPVSGIQSIAPPALPVAPAAPVVQMPVSEHEAVEVSAAVAPGRSQAPSQRWLSATFASPDLQASPATTLEMATARTAKVNGLDAGPALEPTRVYSQTFCVASAETAPAGNARAAAGHAARDAAFSALKSDQPLRAKTTASATKAPAVSAADAVFGDWQQVPLQPPPAAVQPGGRQGGSDEASDAGEPVASPLQLLSQNKQLLGVVLATLAINAIWVFGWEEPFERPANATLAAVRKRRPVRAA